MKELSIEGKAKRYDESYKVAESIHRLSSDPAEIKRMEEIFPELKESEDEKMRRWIINYLDNKALNSGIIQEKTNIKNAIAWLEKQAQKPVDKVEPKKLKKAKFKTGDRIIGIVSGMQYYITEVCDDHYCTESGCIIMFNAQDNFELYKQKPAWSEEDEIHQLHAISLIEDIRDWANKDGMHSLCIERCKESVDWIISLKDRVQPQNLTVTEEELAQAKKDAYNDALDKIEYHSGEPTFDDGWSAAIWYLKKKNTQPQNTWKPSDKQLEALETTLYTNMSRNDERYSVLSEFVVELKRLKG